MFLTIKVNGVQNNIGLDHVDFQCMDLLKGLKWYESK